MTQACPILRRLHVTRIGLIADTHVPDRANRLHPEILELFRNTNLIIHAGDISTPPVLNALNDIAETVAVRGNNSGDWKNFRPPLPDRLRIRVYRNLEIGVWHGMNSMIQRFMDAVIGRSGFYGLIAKRITKRVRNKMPEPQIVVFGHAHWPVAAFDGSQLAVNPGKAFSQHASSCAVLEILQASVRLKIHPLSSPGRFADFASDWIAYPV